MYNPFKIHPPNIDRLSLKLIPKNSKVLELGCGEAKLGGFMENKLGCEVVGVEINSKKAKIAAAKINKVITGDIEDENIQARILKHAKFDVIFASAILEHLKDPAKILTKLTKYLKNSGFVVITLPNIAYWSVRLELLLGRFNYTQSGILDKTHLRFFTIDAAVKFLENDCNLKIELLEFELPRFPFIHRILKIVPYFGEKFEKALYSKFPGFFAYQMVFKAKPK